MFTYIRKYTTEEIGPRVRDIVLHSNAVVAISAAAAVYFLAPSTAIGQISRHALGEALLTYSSIALGFSLTGITLVLALPDTSFVKLLTASTNKHTKKCAYSDLVFVYSWTAVIHWALVVAACVVTLSSDDKTKLYATGNGTPEQVALAAFCGLAIYAISQFLVTIITLSRVGQRYAEHSRKPSE